MVENRDVNKIGTSLTFYLLFYFYYSRFYPAEVGVFVMKEMQEFVRHTINLGKDWKTGLVPRWMIIF